MVQINSSNLVQETRDVAKLAGFNQITEMTNQVVPVIDVNPKHARICNIVKWNIGVNAASTTVYTTPTDKDFYLVAASLALIKDATATSVSSYLGCTIEGSGTRLLLIPSLTLTAQTAQLSISFDKPVKIDRGVTIPIVNSTNNANITVAGTVIGFTVDNPNA